MTIEQGVYGHLRFAFRRLDVDLHPDSVREVAHAVVSWFEMNDLAVVKRSTAHTALAWAQKALDGHALQWPTDIYVETQQALFCLAEELAPNSGQCDDLECPYHRFANHTGSQDASRLQKA